MFHQALKSHSTLHVDVKDAGSREIELLFGDITALPKDDKADLIVVSAFGGK